MLQNVEADDPDIRRPQSSRVRGLVGHHVLHPIPGPAQLRSPQARCTLHGCLVGRHYSDSTFIFNSSQTDRVSSRKFTGTRVSDEALEDPDKTCGGWQVTRIQLKLLHACHGKRMIQSFITVHIFESWKHYKYTCHNDSLRHAVIFRYPSLIIWFLHSLAS